MIEVGDLINPSQYEALKSLKNNKLWAKQASNVSPRELMAFYCKVKSEFDPKTAGSVVEFVRDKLVSAEKDGILKSCRVADFKVPHERLTSERLIGWLNMLPITRRRCMLFALLAGIHPERAVVITWGQLRSMVKVGAISKEAFEVAKLCPRNLFSNRVFWVQGKTRPIPLVGLSSQIKMLTGMTWETLKVAFDDLILIDNRDFKKEFLLVSR